jgi:hypothetical protein
VHAPGTASAAPAPAPQRLTPPQAPRAHLPVPRPASGSGPARGLRAACAARPRARRKYYSAACPRTPPRAVRSPSRRVSSAPRARSARAPRTRRPPACAHCPRAPPARAAARPPSRARLTPFRPWPDALRPARRVPPRHSRRRPLASMATTPPTRTPAPRRPTRYGTHTRSNGASPRVHPHAPQRAAIPHALPPPPRERRPLRRARATRTGLDRQRRRASGRRQRRREAQAHRSEALLTPARRRRPARLTDARRGVGSAPRRGGRALRRPKPAPRPRHNRAELPAWLRVDSRPLRDLSRLQAPTARDWKYRNRSHNGAIILTSFGSATRDRRRATRPDRSRRACRDCRDPPSCQGRRQFTVTGKLPARLGAVDATVKDQYHYYFLSMPPMFN